MQRIATAGTDSEGVVLGSPSWPLLFSEKTKPPFAALILLSEVKVETVILPLEH